MFHVLLKCFRCNMNSDEFIIEEFTGTDESINLLRGIEYICHGETGAPKAWLKEKASKGKTWVIKRYGIIVGFLISGIKSPLGGGFYPYVEDIAVLPDYQYRGLGKRLLDTFEKYYVERGFTSVWLQVNVENPAQTLYFKQGYRVINFNANLYGHGHDGLDMYKNIYK